MEKYNCKIISDNDEIKGFGGSVINGLNHVKSEYFCILDGDGSFNSDDISKMRNKILEGYDFILLLDI